MGSATCRGAISRSSTGSSRTCSPCSARSTGRPPRGPGHCPARPVRRRLDTPGPDAERLTSRPSRRSGATPANGSSRSPRKPPRRRGKNLPQKPGTRHRRFSPTPGEFLLDIRWSRATLRETLEGSFCIVSIATRSVPSSAALPAARSRREARRRPRSSTPSSPGAGSPKSRGGAGRCSGSCSRCSRRSRSCASTGSGPCSSACCSRLLPSPVPEGFLATGWYLDPVVAAGSPALTCAALAAIKVLGRFRHAGGCGAGSRLGSPGPRCAGSCPPPLAPLAPAVNGASRCCAPGSTASAPLAVGDGRPSRRS